LKKVQELKGSSQLPPEAYTQFREGYLALLLIFYFETPLKRDLDGGLKIAQFSLCSALSLNDNRIVSIHLTKYIRYHPSLSPFTSLNISPCKNKRYR
jgi:crossover junction endodeoxyribonuclease RusA